MDEFRRGRNRRSLDSIPARSRTRRVGARPSKRGGRGGSGFRRLFSWKWLLLVFLTTILLIIGGCSALLMQGEVIELEKMDEIEYPSTIYDVNNKPVAKLGKDIREFVTIQDIEKVNPDLPEAFVKVEDARFYKHSGIDYYGFGRAIWTNIKSLGKAQGASTITMQVAGNVILENREKRISRKISEMATALNIERKYGKKKILETYLNFIGFGHGVYGIKMAAKFYFNKDITKDKLEPHEIAYLAGLPKAPYTYDCYGSEKLKAKALKRRNVVLGEMKEDYIRPPIITEAQYEKAKALPLSCNKEGRLAVSKALGKKDRTAAYKDLLTNELVKRYGIPESDLTTKGYRIYTGMDIKVQNKITDVLKEDKSYHFKEKLDGGAISIDPQTGLVRAVGGGRNYVRGTLNNAFEVEKQPGSSIKPITVYGPAVEESDGRINEFSILKDEPIKIGDWSPKNSHGGPQGPVPMVKTVKESLNLSTLHLLKENVGLQTAFEYAKKAGLEDVLKQDIAYAPMGLGGLSKGVTALQMAQAYSTFAHNGSYIPAHTIRKIEVKNDDEWEEVLPKDDKNEEGSHQLKDKQVFSKKTAYYMTRMLREVVRSGTGKPAQLENNRPVAGKTGTTNNGKEAYFVGYTPQLVTAVFIYNTSKDEIELSGAKYPAAIFKKIMDTALKDKPIVDFKNPGVPEPTPPFQLKGPRLTGSYVPSQKAIVLNWNAQGSSGRILYDLYRDGQLIQSKMASNSYTDTDIDTGGGIFGGLFGNKSYTYKVVAVDTETNQQTSSNSVTVKVSNDGDDNDPVDCSKPENASKPECNNDEVDCNDPANAGKPECQNQDGDQQNADGNGQRHGQDQGDRTGGFFQGGTRNGDGVGNGRDNSGINGNNDGGRDNDDENAFSP